VTSGEELLIASGSGLLVTVGGVMTAEGAVSTGADAGAVLPDFAELSLRPPVATTTPDAAERNSARGMVVVDVCAPVDPPAVLAVAAGAAEAAAVSDVAAGCFELASVAEGAVPDDVDPGLSAWATPHPHPVMTAAPTPMATANPPIRPT
jgi:hypothetical protein